MGMCTCSCNVQEVLNPLSGCGSECVGLHGSLCGYV